MILIFNKKTAPPPGMQTLLTDIRIRGHSLKLSLQGLGSFTAVDYKHTFPLRRVPPSQVAWAWNELSRREALQSHTRREVNSFFDLIQVDGPMEIARRKSYTLGQIKEHLLHHPDLVEVPQFVTRMVDYLIKSPPSALKPYTINSLREHLYAHPKVEERHKPTIDKILAVLEEGWPVHGTDDSSPRVWVPSPLPKEFFRGGYTALARWRIAPKGSIVEVDDSLVAALEAGSREIPLENRIKYRRVRTAAELLQETMSIVDIEIPLFDTREAQVSWASVVHYSQRQSLGATVFSLYQTPPSGEFQSEQSIGERELVEKVKKSIRDSESTIFVAYNVPFDAIKLREAGNFEIGEDDEEPKKVATLPFFERIGIKARDVLDLYRWARIQFEYLPNQKLVTVLRYLRGESSFRKEITYRQQAQLERICQGRDPTEASQKVQAMLAERSAPEIIASYVHKDTAALVDILDSEIFRQGVEDACYLGQLFTIDPFLLLHDAKRIQDFLERRFFEKVGTFRDAIYPRFKVFTQYEHKVKEKLKREVKRHFPTTIQGTIENCTKVYLPLGRILQQDVQWFFPEARKLYAYVDSHRDDPQRRFFLARYEDALAEWMWKDYAAFLYEQAKFDELTKEMDQPLVERRLMQLRTRLTAHGLEERVRKGTIAQYRLQAGLSDEDRRFMDEQRLDLPSFHRLFKQWSRVRQKNRILWGAYETGWRTFDSRLEGFCKGVQDYFQGHGVEVVHADHRYLYVRGSEQALREPNCPVIPVDHIPQAYVAGGKIYYPRYGFIAGFKREERPTNHLSLFEMETFGNFLDNVFQRNHPDALEEVWIGLDALGGHNLPPREMIHYVSSRGFYRALTLEGEIEFYEWDQHETSRTKMLRGKEYVMKRQTDQTRKRDYILEPEYDGKELVEVKRWLINPKELHLDWERYVAKAAAMALSLVRPLLTEDSASFVRDALSSEPRHQLEFYVSA